MPLDEHGEGHIFLLQNLYIMCFVLDLAMMMPINIRSIILNTSQFVEQ